MKTSWKISGGKIRVIVFLVFLCVMVSSIAPLAFSEESGFQFGKDNALQINLMQYKGKTNEIQFKSFGQLVGKLSEF
jgi:hypothetical protein